MRAAQLFKTKEMAEWTKGTGKVFERESVMPLYTDIFTRKGFAVNKLIAPGPLRSRAEMKTMLSTIDRELERHKSIAELDFIAGYLTGKIYEKEINDFIIHRQAVQLKNILYAKYEAIRTLEEQMRSEKE